MIGLIAKLQIQDGKSEEFEAFASELARQVRANEKGCVAYQLAKSRTEPNTYTFIELYTDQDALTLHGTTPYFKAAGPKFAAVLAGAPQIEHMDVVG